MIRKPVVAGQFYTGSETLLKKELAKLVAEKKERFDAIGVVSPHAGYVYSGAIAGETLASIKPRPAYIMLGPNHTGYGKVFGLDSERTWKTPLGEIEVDRELAKRVLECVPHVKEDTLCHDYEHSIEVELPFLQFLNKNFTIVPIVISYSDRKTYKEIGKGISEAVKGFAKEVTIIASSDMTHYEPHDIAKRKDKMAIDKILSLDVDGFLDTVEKYDISMCGFAPAAIMMEAAIGLGAKKAELVRYATSGDASGDYSSVVGYAGIVIY